MSPGDFPDQLTLVEEQLEISKREIERGSVLIRTHVAERDETATVELQHQDVDVERVPVGREVTSMPSIREEDGVLIVPIVDEELVVGTRLILREELRISRRSRAEKVHRTVRLRSEQAEITRTDKPHPTSPNPEEP
jgi:uncharacterized protein (TIGR02271 family)